MSIELAPHFHPRPVHHVLMDWDGTTALSRAGWADLMTDVYVENLPSRAAESPAQLRSFAWDELMRMNGRAAIHQMAHLAELIRLRGGQAADAAHYQADFQQRLSALVSTRLDDVRSGRRAADSLLVPGVRAMFTALRGRGVPLTLASGTPIDALSAEAALLGMAEFFDGRIHGPDDLGDRTFTKQAIISQLLATHALDGDALIAFGDGPVEIAATKAIGGVAVAVASDERNPGNIDAFKRESLLAAGADAVIADFSNLPALLSTFDFTPSQLARE